MGFRVCKCLCMISKFPLSLVAWQVKYKEVMKQYGLGPNGGILTACNLFATKFDEVFENGAFY